jgi:hypothetical protein
MRPSFFCTLTIAPLLACATPNKVDTSDFVDAPVSGSKDGADPARPDASADQNATSDSLVISDSPIGHDVPTPPPDQVAADTPTDAPAPDASGDRPDAASACTGTRCGFECVDTNSNPLHCGKCMIACAGTCSVGKCACEPASAANLVRNGGFDTTTSDWQFGSKLALSRGTEDASSCSASGSLTLTYAQPGANFTPDIWQCIELASDQGTFNAGVWTRIEPTSPRGYVDFWVEWYPQPACQQQDGISTPYERRALPETERTGEWRKLGMNNITPRPGTRSVRIRFGIYAQETSTQPFVAHADMIYFTPAPGGWR